MSAINRIYISGYPALSAMVRHVIQAAINQRKPSRELRKAVNEVLAAIDHPLSTKRKRKGEEVA